MLWVKAGKLLPVNTGGRIRSYNLLRQLEARCQVTLLSYYGGPRDDEYEKALRDAIGSAVPVHAGWNEASSLGTALDYVRRSWSPVPYAVTRFAASGVRRLIHEWDAEGRFDVLVCDFLAASLNFPRRPRTATVLFQHNVESILWRRQAGAERHPLRKAVFRLEALKMARYEPAAARRFDHVIAVSDTDRSAMLSMTGPNRISVVPTGVDTGSFRPDERNQRPEPIVLFLGSMDWEANVDGVQHFCDRIWPLIRHAVPGARFQIVGRAPGPAVKRLASSSVEVVGTVQSVVEYLHRAAVVVVPLRVGGGTRLKIYEAMAAGKAVVSTGIGAEGLDWEDGRDILIADTPEAFARAVVRILQDPVERTRLEDAALALASQHDWSRIARRFESVVEAVVREHRQGASRAAA